MWKRRLNRVQPVGPVQVYQTFQAAAPLSTHWRKATCAEVDCAHYINGWATTVLAGSDDEALIRRAGRAFVVERQQGGFLRFVFHAGQPCFKAHQHKVPLERDPLFIVRGGDWRANTGLIRQHTRGVDWVDHFATHQDQLIARQNRG